MAAKNAFSIQFGRLVAYHGADTEVVVPDGVTIIGRRAFYGNGKIVSVMLPASVETVEQEAFCDCGALQTIIISGMIKQAGANAFGHFFGKEALELSVYSAVPIRAFTKAAQDSVLRTFSRRFSEFDPGVDVVRDDLRFLGTHLKQPQEFENKQFYHYLLENPALRREVLAAEAIPAKELKWLIPAVQEAGQPEITAELLDYQNRLLADKKTRKTLEQAEAKAEEKALSGEMTVADWRKRLRFGYENGDVVIKEVLIREPVIEIPDRIGERRVRVIDRRAFSCNLKPGEAKQWSPKKIILPEGVEEIRSGAFFCAKNTEIFFPNSVKKLPDGCFIAVRNITLHLTAAIEHLPDELEWDSATPAFKALHAPAGSYAEQYAKEHDIPFAAE